MSTADSPAPKPPVLTGPPPQILLITAPYYFHVVDGMETAAKDILQKVNAVISTVEVSGAFELPQALALAAKSGKNFDGYIVLGCVVRGETDHYEFISAATMTGLMDVAIAHGLCLGTALLTVDTLAQAVARSHETGANKGAEAAVACLKQILIARQFAA
jgi:6,7-dimethyl-8-ribityllumazine synthase